MKENDFPAYPIKDIYTTRGMTFRDACAIAAMQGAIVRSGLHQISIAGIADLSYEMADAMLKAREK